MTALEDLLGAANWRSGTLSRRQYDTEANTQDERSVVASFQADRPMVIREDRAVDLAIPAHETFTTDGSGNEETHAVSYNLYETPVTEPLVLFSDGDPVNPDSIDFDADEFTYTDGGAAEELDAYYIPRDPVTIEFRKTAPGGGSTMREKLKQIPSAIAHTRDTAKRDSALSFSFHGLGGVIPRKWRLEVVVDAPYPIEFGEDTRGTTATNALLEVPKLQTEERLRGLKDAVKADVAGV